MGFLMVKKVFPRVFVIEKKNGKNERNAVTQFLIET